MAYVEDKQAEYEAEVAKTLAIAPNYGEVYRVAGQLAANNYRFDEAVTLTRQAIALDPNNADALTDLGTHLLRTGDEPGARGVARTVLQAASLQRRDVQPAGHDGQARHVRDISRRRSDLPHAEGRGAGSPRVHRVARPQGARRILQAVPVHAQGPDSHRGLRQARRLRRQERRTARDGRRSRRLLRPRRDDGLAEGASAGIVPVGGDALARAGPRHHDRDVEPADSPVAHRGHFRVRREARPAGMGARTGPGIRHAARSRRNDQASGAERRVHEPADYFTGLFRGGAAGRAPRRAVRR